MGNLISSYINGFASLFFPQLCHSCGTTLVDGEHHFCTSCLYDFPYTNYHLIADNKIAKQFWGRTHIEAATAMLFFNKGSKVQNIMHQFKYNNQPQIGIELGKQYGRILKETHPYNVAEGIIPVPLHPKKLIKRGYNQSEQFAIGLSESLGIPVFNDILFRHKSAESQTTKSRRYRFDNISSVFKANSTSTDLKNVLLVDDTITTGATLETCAIALQEIGIEKINFVGLAFAEA